VTKRDKLLARFLRVPKDLSFSEFKSVAESFDFELDDATGSSHVVFFHKQTNTPINAVKPHGKTENTVKPNYIRAAIKVFKEMNFIDGEGNRVDESISKDESASQSDDLKQIEHNPGKEGCDG
jgi:hypothetical protein